MAFVYTRYYPDTDVDSQWSLSTGSASYALVDEATPATGDYVYITTGAGNQGKVVSFKAASSAEDYASCPMAEWASFQGIAIEAYAMKYSTGTPTIRAYLQYNGTKYWAQGLFGDDVRTVSSTTGANYLFTWTEAPWDTTGMINWGVAPKDMIFGVEKYNDAGNVKLYACRLRGYIDDHTPVTIDEPINLIAETGQNRLDSVLGSTNPTDVVPWDVTLSFEADYDDVCGCEIQVGTSVGASDMWNSGLIQLGALYDDGDTISVTYDGDILQDGVTYYWRVKAYDVWCDASDWSTGATFVGVTDSEWWDEDFHSRFNIRMGTDHSELAAGDTVEFDMQTGYGLLAADYGHVNEAIQHSARSICYHDGFSYIVFLGNTALSGYMKNYVIKFNHSTRAFSAAVQLEDVGTATDTHLYPNIIVGADNKLHVFRAGHPGNIHYFRTTGAHSSGTGIDITSWTTDAPIAVSATYPRPVIDSAGTIYVFYRGWAGATHQYGCFAYVYSTDNGANWSAEQYVIYYDDYIDAPPSVYCGGVGIDSNDRVHILISWWDDYGGSNKGRAMSYIYADKSNGKYETWYEKETAGSVGSTTTTLGATNIHYDDCSKIVTCTDPDTSQTQPFYHSNSEALVIDDDDEAHFVFYSYGSTGTNIESPIYYCYWDDTEDEWVIVDTYTDESLPKVWKYRQGGQLYYDDGIIYIYGFVKPTGETRFGGELYRWRRVISTDSWGGEYLTKNSGKGIGMMSVLPRVYTGKNREIVFTQCNDLVWMEDVPLLLVRADADDVRIVEAYNNGTTIAHTEIDRLPVTSFQREETAIEFALNTGVSADTNAPTDRIIQCYVGKYNASSAPHDPDDVYLYYEGFEEYTSNTVLDGQGGWTMLSGTDTYCQVFSSIDQTNYSNAHTNKLWDGDRFLRFQGSIVLAKALDDTYPGLGEDVTGIDVRFHIWDEGGAGYVYLELYDETGDAYVALGLNCGDNYAGYMTSGSAWSNELVLTGTRYYEFRLILTSSGSAGYVWNNGDWVEVFSGDTEITVCDQIRIAASGSFYGIFDSITVRSYFAEAPSTATNEDDAEVFFELGTARMCNAVSLVHEKTARMGNVVLPMKEAVGRLHNTLSGEKETAARLASAIIAEAVASGRLASAIIAEAVASGRLASAIIAEAVASGRLGQYLTLETDATGRIANVLIADAMAAGRINNAVEGDKTELARIINIAILEATASGRLGQYLTLETDATGRIANVLIADAMAAGRINNAVEGDKTELARIINIAILEAVASGRLGQYLTLDKVALGRIGNILLGDKEVGARIRNAVHFEGEITERLANFIIGEAVAGSRMGSALILEDTSTDRLAQLIINETQSFARLNQILSLDDTDTARIAHIVMGDKDTSARIINIILGDKAVTSRMANAVAVESAATSRLANIVLRDKVVVSRLYNILLGEAHRSDRTAHMVHFEDSFVERIANALNLEDTDVGRLASILLGDKEVVARVCNSLLMDKEVMARVGSALVLSGGTFQRMANALALEAGLSDRAANIVLSNAAAVGRLMNDIMLEIGDTARLANTLDLLSGGTGRMANAAELTNTAVARIASAVLVEKISVARIASAVLFVNIPSIMGLFRKFFFIPQWWDITAVVPAIEDKRMSAPSANFTGGTVPEWQNVIALKPNWKASLVKAAA